MFKRTALSYGKSDDPVTPYQKAAQVWDERMGTSRVQARNWRLMAFGCLGAHTVRDGDRPGHGENPKLREED